MKVFRDYEDMPPSVYIGSECSDGTMPEEIADAIEKAVNPVILLEDGIRHYFDLV